MKCLLSPLSLCFSFSLSIHLYRSAHTHTHTHMLANTHYISIYSLCLQNSYPIAFLSSWSVIDIPSRNTLCKNSYNFFCLYLWFFPLYFCFYSLMLLLLLSRFSHVRLCATSETAAHQAPQSLGLSRQEHWSGLPFPSPMHESEKWKWSHSVVSNS